MSTDSIVVRGARVHNLKNIDFEIEHNTLTVATATEIFDYLRLLFARVGRTYCLLCGQEVKKDTVDEVVDRLLAFGEGTRLNVFFPIQTHVPAAEEKSAKKSRAKKKLAESHLPFGAISDAIK